LLAALAIAAALPSWSALAAVGAEPPVKLSRNGICHERGTSAYAATLHYKPFDTLADCIEAGGRVAKNRRATETHAPSLPAMADRWSANGIFIWRELLSPLAGYFAFGAAATLLWGATVFIRRLACHPR